MKNFYSLIPALIKTPLRAILFLSFFLLFHFSGITQNFQWAQAMGGTTYESGNSIALDASGNVYTTGYFQGTVDFDPGPGTFTLTSEGGSSDIFISKLDASGNFLWAKSMGGTGYDQAHSIKVDGANNIYVLGSFEDVVDFDPSAGIFNLTSAGGADIFLLKLDSSGNFIWAKAIGGIDYDEGYAIALDGTDKVYATGGFGSSVDFDPNAGIFYLVSTGGADIFISKLDSSGNFVWAKAMGGAYWDVGHSIAIDGMGNVLTAGYYQDIADFDPDVGTYTITSNGGDDVFISKLDASGNFLWANAMGGPNSDMGHSITTDGTGNVYITGQLGGNYGLRKGIFNQTFPDDIFISKLDAFGNFLWTDTIGGMYFDAGRSIALDGTGNVYITGYFEDIADFNPDTGTFNLTSAGYKDIFILKIDTSGNFLWAKAIGGMDWDEARSITTDGAGNVYTTGSFYQTADFDPNAATFNLISAGGNDIFVSKLGCYFPTYVYSTNTTCHGGNNGTATVMPGGGTPPYTYVWNPSGGSSSIATGLYAGNYTVTVTDNNGCTETATVTITEPPALTTTVSSNNPNCNGETGSACVNASGGTPDYTFGYFYSWSNGSSSSCETGLSTGIYTVTVTDANGCTSTATAVITEPPALTVTISATDTICYGVNTGSATANPNGGTLPYSYSWSNNQTTQTIIDLSAGNYIVTVTDANGCSANDTVFITQRLPIPLSVTVTNTSCGNTTGGAIASVNGPGAFPPFSYLWNTGSTSPAINGVLAGLYRVNVTDGNGCFSFADALISNSNGPVITINSITDVSCHGMSNGAIDVNVTSGAPPYTYFWSNGETTQDISNLTYGPYEIHVTDASGCVAIKSIFVNEPAMLAMTASSVNSDCAQSNGSATAFVSGGIAPYSYSWSNGQTSSTATGLTSGTYSVIITDAKGCVISNLVPVSDNGGPGVLVDTISAVHCGSSGFVIVSPLDSLAIQSYSWTNGNNTQNLSNVSAGNYGLVVTDTSGCKSALVVAVTPVLPSLKPLCVVTVDTLTNENIVVWEKPVSSVIAGFNIYRESSQNGIYQFIAFHPYSATSTYYDLVPNPNNHWSRYKIAIKDVCGNEGPKSPAHKTIHLSIQSTNGDTTNLIWDDYSGYPFSYYYIFRKNSSVGYWQMIDSVAFPINVYSDTATPLIGDSVYYHVDVKTPDDCEATILHPIPFATTIKTAKSNSDNRVGDTTTTWVKDNLYNYIKLYPNPNNGSFIISSTQSQITHLTVYNTFGQIVYQKPFNQKSAEIKLPPVPSGLYQLQLILDKKIINRKIIVQ